MIVQHTMGAECDPQLLLFYYANGADKWTMTLIKWEWEIKAVVGEENRISSSGKFFI